MDLYALLSLAIVTFIYAISPGPGVFAVLATATRYGGLSAVWLSIGHTITDIFYVSVAIFAITFIASTIDQALIFIKIFGAIYLCYLGVMQWNSSGVSFETTVEKRSIVKLFVAGFVIGGTNPKTVIYYLSFLPVFMSLDNLSTMDTLNIILIVGLMVFLALNVATIIGIKLRDHIQNPKVIEITNKTTGMMMILVGIFVGLY